MCRASGANSALSINLNNMGGKRDRARAEPPKMVSHIQLNQMAQEELGRAGYRIVHTVNCQLCPSQFQTSAYKRYYIKINIQFVFISKILTIA